MPKATPLVLGVLLLLALPPHAAQAQSLLFDYLGFDYEDPDPVAATFGEPGSSYVGLGTVPGLFAPLVADTTTYEYTYVISGLSVASVLTFPPSYEVVNYNAGTLKIYEDSKALGTAADFGSNPPNGTAPPTFVDGTLFLNATLTGFQLVLNTATGTGSYEAVLEVTGGSQFGNFSSQKKGWTFAGTTGNALNVPPGYAHQVDGQVFLNEPSITRHASWGRIKKAYR
jgi:hypothetical protein